MSVELPKAYDPTQTDRKWYQFWLENKFFEANPHSEKPSYCIVIPPPNVTGVLHMGHALVDTLQDVLIRWKRMCGYEALWVPGTDHAGIATQAVVERNLLAKEGKRRKDFSREDFLKHVWAWKEEKESSILQQIKLLGCSCDWSRYRFTMDEQCSKAVKLIFKRLYDQGLIYRGDYLVNWDPVTQTALADDEVEYEEKNSFLWYIRYQIENSDSFITIATTRPETLLGDTAVAVSPKDPRYTSFIGKRIKLPFVNRSIEIIADDFVDPEFGTGAVKITPAHDPNDYQMGLRHHLEMINIMTPDGKINSQGKEFEGLSMEEARLCIVARLKEMGLLEKEVPHLNRVGVSYRSKAVIEPYLSKQWFVKMSSASDMLKKAVESEEVKLIPNNWSNTYFHWINNLRDWCISRQLWWGHRIPIWYSIKDPEKMICYEGEGVPPEVAAAPEDWRQDEDVLDTWFSSALWPFSTLGWPDDTADLKKFYPNSILITGHDILFFWVARMLFMGKWAIGEFPFPEVFLNGLIYGKSYWRNNPGGGITYVLPAEQIRYDMGQEQLPKDVHHKWEKMSKSKGNVIDPMELVEQYGTDAVRLTLCASSPQLRQIDLDRRKFEEFKNFTNKIWNGFRFVLMNLQKGNEPNQKELSGSELAKGICFDILTLDDRWILSKLNRVIKEVNEALSTYRFENAALAAYDFFWKEFCAYYVEMTKPILFGKEGNEALRVNKQKILSIVMVNAIQLLHPIAPFITEEIFQILKSHFTLDDTSITSSDPYTNAVVQALLSKACIVSPFPEKPFVENDISLEVETNFSKIEEVIYTIRNIRAEMQIPPSTAIDVYFVAQEENALGSLLKVNHLLIRSLVRIKTIDSLVEEPAFGLAATGIVEGVKIIVPLPAELVTQEKARLEKERERIVKNLEKIEVQLSNPTFIDRAPKELVEKQLQLKSEQLKEIMIIDSKLQNLS